MIIEPTKTFVFNCRSFFLYFACFIMRYRSLAQLVEEISKHILLFHRLELAATVFEMLEENSPDYSI